MSYTIAEYNINGSNPLLENELLAIWAKFCFKSKPLPFFEKKTVHALFSAAYEYFLENFVGNRCFYIENEAFVIFGDGQKWLDNPISELDSKKTAVLIMAASINNSPKLAWEKIARLKECFCCLKKDGYNVVAWNLNRQFKRKPFARMIKTLGAKTVEDCQYVEL